MAGGEGTRLRPLTYNQPKPLVPMANRPLMEHVVGLLRHHGLRDIVVTVGPQADAIRAYFGDGSELGVKISYATEQEPLGTAGSVRNAAGDLGLGEAFLVISGDVLTDMDLSALVELHEANRAVATVALKPVPNPLEFGVVITGRDGAIERFLEKPSWGEVFSDLVNTGVYVLGPEVLEVIGPGAADFSTDVFPRLLQEGKRLYGFPVDGYWQDVGTLDAYLQAHQDILDGRVHVEVPGPSPRRGIWLGEGAEVDPRAELPGPALVGDYCRVGPGAVVGAYSVLGRNVQVGADARLGRVVVHDNVRIGPGARLHGCTVGRGSDLRRGVRVEDGAVIGDECSLGEHALVRSGVKVYPFKTIEHGAVVSSSIVQESKGARRLFGRRGVSGLANVDVSPELAVRLAMALGTTMPKGSRVVVSRDMSTVAKMLERALVAGLNASGLSVVDLEATTVPVTRFGARATSSAGGITVRRSADDPQLAQVMVFDAHGADLAEAAQRKVERTFYREDFRRCLSTEVGDVSYPVPVTASYAQALLDEVDVGAVRASGFKVVVDHGYAGAPSVVPQVLGQLGADVVPVNPYAPGWEDEPFDRWGHAGNVASAVQAAGADLGAVIGPEGETLTLVDGTGHVLSDTEGMLALLRLVLGLEGGTGPPGPRTVALPVSAPRAAEATCQQASATVVWAKLSSAHLMEVSSRPGVAFAAGPEGGYIFPSFLPAYDAVAALVHTLGLLSAAGARLSEVVARLPKACSAHEEVVTPWEKKGLVMRSVMSLGQGKPLVLVDGVKVVHEGGWVLVVPDPEEALTHVWADGSSDAHAQDLAAGCARRIRSFLLGERA